MPHFNGPHYDGPRDNSRLLAQFRRILHLMSDGAWRTLGEIEGVTGDPQASISAQLRHMRKPRFGSYVVELRLRGDRSSGLYEYRVLPPSTFNAVQREPLEITEMQLPRVDGGFGVIVADPPWSFDNKATRAAAEDHYETMSPAELIYMPVKEIAAPNAHLALWTTDTHKELAFHVMEAWGFKYKCEAVWVKTNDLETRLYADAEGAIKIGHFLTDKWIKEDNAQMIRNEPNYAPVEVSLQIGLGNYFRHAHETVMFGTRGKAGAKIKNVPSVLFAPRQEHSAKPEILQTFLEQMSNPPGLELFARRQRPGWAVWGNEFESVTSRLVADDAGPDHGQYADGAP